MTSTPRSTAPPQRPPFRTALTILHLSALGVLGWVAFAAAIGLFAAGLGTALVFGIGLVFLLGLVYALFGISWFETERVSGLYRLGVPSLRPVRREAPGFGGYLRSVFRQFVDERMWQGIGSFAVASALGTVMLVCVQTLLWAVGSALASALGGDPMVALGIGPVIALTDWPVGPVLYGVVGVLSAASVVGCALLHRLIAVRIVRSGTRNSELEAAAAVSAQRREDAVRAADVERTRIERDLHDGVQPRLVSVGMALGLAQQRIDTDPEGARELIVEAHASTKEAITELRQLARGIHPSVLDDRGLDAALSAVAGRSHIPVVLDARLDRRCDREAETAVYFAIAEALTNAAKHSGASECRVVVRLRDGHTLWARVEDNGRGGALVLPGGGLDGIVNRIAAAGGSVRIDSPQGGPTSVEVSVPCAS